MKQFFFTILALLFFNNTYAQVKATSAEINTGTDDDKFATALALQGSKYLDQNGAKISAVTYAGANTYIASITPAITAYISGQVFYIKITTANTGASTLNLNGLGAKALVKDANTPVVSGDLLAGKVYAVYYDGANFQVMNIAGTGTQMLSLGATMGNVVISGGNNITLTTLGIANRPDADVTEPGGFKTYLNTTGSVNYPAAGGGGINYSRAAGTNLGSFNIWKNAFGTDELYYRTGATATTFNPWKIIADRAWVASQIPTAQTLTTSGLSGNISITGGNSITLTSLFPNGTTIFPDANILPAAAGLYPYNTTTGSVGYPVFAGSGFKSVRQAATGLGYFELFKGAVNDGNSVYIRSGTSATSITPFEKIATQEWATSAFAPIAGGTYLPLIGGTLQSSTAAKLILKKTATGQGNYIAFHNDTGNLEGYVGLSSSSNNNMALIAGSGNDLILGANNTSRLTVGASNITSTLPLITNGVVANNSLLISQGAESSNNRGLLIRTGTSNRWFVNASAAPESGSNAGSNFSIIRYNDAGNAFGNVMEINRSTGNTLFSGTVSAPTFIATTFEGNASTATSTTLLSSIPRYTWTHDMLPNDYALGIQTSFVQQATPGGWQSFGSVMTMKGYPGGGGTLQLYTPYGTAYGGNNLQVRFGDYGVNSGNSWTGWKTLMNQGDNAASATKLAIPRTINGVSFDGSANITIDAVTQASVTTLDANAVHKTGNETIAGVKLFSTSIGIGTTNVHTYKLAVGGGIIAESVKVKPQAQWPDYVFEKDYPILPLNELEKFVLKNKHLPYIPNAAEVKKDGIDIGEMNARLLQKIEELTLYIIGQQKELENLKEKIKIDDSNETKRILTENAALKDEMKKISEVVGKLSTDMNLIKNK